MNFKSFIFDKPGKIAKAYKFAFLTFAIELALAMYLLLNISIKSRFTGFLSLENWLVILTIISFYFRVLGLHLILGTVIRIFEIQYSVKLKTLLYFLVFLYAYLFIAVKFPQIFDEFPLVSSSLKMGGLFNFPWIVYGPGILILIFLTYSRLSASKLNAIQFFNAIFGLSCLGFYFFYVQSFTVPIQMPPPRMSVKPSKPHIILITVDSLRGDFPLEDRTGISKGFADYLSNSVKFKRVVSPLPQTHSALISLLTSKTPPYTGVRTNLSFEGLNGEILFKNSPLSQLDSAGYKIKILRDNSEYAFFDSKSLFTKNRSPDYSIANVVISTFFKNRIVFGLFNNFVGRLLLPEIDQNAAFIFAYDVPSFTNSVLKELDSVSQQADPHLIFVHTCSLHWPGAFPYPYYPQTQFSNESQSPFAYTSKFHGLTQASMTQKQWQIQADFNGRIYQSGVQLTVDEFLSPIFTELHDSGLDENSIVVLLSDHGEDIWKSGDSFPKSKPVQHGTSLLFGASSEFSYLRIKAPGLRPTVVADTVGLIDVLPTAMSLAGVKPERYEGRDITKELPANIKPEAYYTETGLWPFPSFIGQFISTPATDLGPLFKLEPQGSHIYIDPEKVPGIIQQKQRAIIKGNYRFTVFPTNYGYSEFLCDLKNDRVCEKNILLTNPSLGHEFKDKMKIYIEKDIAMSQLKIGQCSRFKGQAGSSDFSNIKKFQWNYFYQALECIYNFHAYEYANAILDKLMESKDTSVYLKHKIKDVSLKLCGLSLVYNGDHLPDHLINHFNSIPTNGTVFPETFENPINSARCLMAIKDQYRLDIVLKNMSLKNSLALSSGSNSPKLSDESQKILNFETMLDAKKNNYLALESGVSDFFKIEENYNLVEEMEPYWLRALDRVHTVDKSERLFILLRNISKPGSIGLTLFNSTLWEIDQLLGPFSKNGQLSGLRNEPGSKHPLDEPPHNLRFREVSLALEMGQKYFCNQSHKMCVPTKKLYADFKALGRGHE